MRIVKASSAEGKRIISIGEHYEGNNLYQVYDHPSVAKQLAFARCEEMCRADEGEVFGICSHNTFSFTCSWFPKAGGMRVETANNSYLVVFGE